MTVLDRVIGAAEASVEAAEIARRIQQSVVLVRSDGGGSGSGVVWRSDGSIVTNSHVVPHQAAIVESSSGIVRSAELVRRDPLHDLALLAVDAGIAPAAPSRVTPPLRVGEIVLAVGNPFGMRNVVTAGIVSADGGQPWPGREGIRDAIQADIRLLPGNSGGPLLDAAGNVVGVNAMVVSGSLALAIPSRTVERFLRGSNGAFLGVGTQLVDLRRLANTPRPTFGLLVTDIRAGSPADRAGLLVGDILLEADGEPLVDATALAGTLAERSPGQVIVLQLVRGGLARRTTVELGKRLQ